MPIKFKGETNWIDKLVMQRQKGKKARKNQCPEVQSHAYNKS